MRNTFFLACATLASALALAGCGDSGSGSGGNGGAGGGSGGSGGGSGGAGGTAPALDVACQSFASNVCGQIESCAPFLLKVTYGDRATCEARLFPRCLQPPALDGTTLDAADVQTCADAYDCHAVLGGAAPAACSFPGTKADGAPCAATAQCEGGLCESGVEGSCGVCQSVLGEGEACKPDEGNCAPGLFCGLDEICIVPGGQGATCAAGNPCEGGLSCNAGKCGAPLGEGASCANDESCDLAHGGVICNPFTNVCTEVLLAEVGQKCGLGADSVTLCKADLSCVGEVCVVRPKAGESCTVDPGSGNGNCVVGFDCIAGTCSDQYLECK